MTLRRSSLTRRSPMTRKGSLRSVPTYDPAKAKVERAARLAVLLRDETCRLDQSALGAPPCFGPLTVHHLRKRSSGGTWDPENLTVLCSGCNSWVEDFPATAHRLGLVVRRGETVEEAWARMRAAGLGRGSDPFS